MGGNADVVPGIENNFSEGADHTVENLVFAFAVMTGKCLVPGFFCRIDDLFRQFGAVAHELSDPGTFRQTEISFPEVGNNFYFRRRLHLSGSDFRRLQRAFERRSVDDFEVKRQQFLSELVSLSSAGFVQVRVALTALPDIVQVEIRLSVSENVQVLFHNSKKF